MVEQRILAQAARLRPDGAVTGWAALRWRGAAFFDGRDRGGSALIPVPLVISGAGSRAPDPAVAYSWEQFAPHERELVAGLACTSIPRALFDEVRRTSSVRAAVVSVDMAAAARLISVSDFRAYVETRPAWTRVGIARGAVDLAHEASRSPQESRMRLVWVLDAGLPSPVCNRPVFGLDGRLLGYPDLLDPDAGLVGEYDGADHLLEDRRRADRAREELFRDHGLEYVAVVRGDLADTARVARRLVAAYRRAPHLPEDRRRWTLQPPPRSGANQIA